MNVIFKLSTIPPDGEADSGGSEVQFDLGDGKLKYRSGAADHIVKNDNAKNKDGTSKDLDFNARELHGLTVKESIIFGNNPPKITRAFIFVPKTPQVSTPKGRRGVGKDVMTFIALHELIHACGLSNGEHNVMGPDADVFTDIPQVDYGTSGPSGDRIQVESSYPTLRYCPPFIIKKRVSDLITQNWT